MGRMSTRKSRGRWKPRLKSKGKLSDKQHLTNDGCAYCNQKGHWKKDYLHKEKKEPKVNVAQNGIEDLDAALTFSSSLITLTSEILDSGCYYHSPYRDLLFEL